MTARPQTSALSRPLTAPARAVRQMVASMLADVGQWRVRRRTRAALARLDPHLLKDIGLDPHRAALECAKPFWRD